MDLSFWKLRIKALILDFTALEFTHIYREFNQEADDYQNNHCCFWKAINLFSDGGWNWKITTISKPLLILKLDAMFTCLFEGETSNMRRAPNTIIFT
jgi:hypothetical protein